MPYVEIMPYIEIKENKSKMPRESTELCCCTVLIMFVKKYNNIRGETMIN